MIYRKPSGKNWKEQGQMFDLMAAELFQNLRAALMDSEQLDFEDMYDCLETWRSHPDSHSNQRESSRWEIMHSLLWCAEHSSEDS